MTCPCEGRNVTRLREEPDADGTREHIGKCYRDTFGAVYRVQGYDGNKVHYAIYDLANRGKITARQHSEPWADFLADLQGEVDCPQPDSSSD